MTEPYFTRPAGAFLSADDWNEVQVRALEELHGHEHPPRSLSGDSVDPGANLSLKEAHAEQLRLRGRSPAELIAERLDRSTIGEALRTRLPLNGGTVTGDLHVAGDLHVKGALRVAGGLQVGGRELGAGVDASEAFRQFLLPSPEGDPYSRMVYFYPSSTESYHWHNRGDDSYRFELPWRATIVLVIRTGIRTGSNTAWPASCWIAVERRGEAGDWGSVLGIIPALDQSRCVDIEQQRVMVLDPGSYFLYVRSHMTLICPRFIVLAFRELT